jgi:NADH dehydrogenase
MKTHHICILGGTGFVGHSLTAKLSAAGHDITVLTRHQSRHRDMLLFPRVTLKEVDLFDHRAFVDALTGCDMVINLIGILNEYQHDGSGFQKIHVELADRLIVAMKDSHIYRLLHLSALNADQNASSHYLKTKAEAEKMLLDEPILQVSSFRPSVIFGQDDQFFNRFAKLLRWIPLGFPLACAKSRFSPVYVKDVTSALVNAMDDKSTFGKTFNLCGPSSYSLEELLQYTIDITGAGVSLYPLSDRFSRWQANVLEYVPGKPFSKDNYRSLQHDSVCQKGQPSILCDTPLESVVPSYLANDNERGSFSRHRQSVNRD